MATMMSFGKRSGASLICSSTISAFQIWAKSGHFHQVSHALVAIQGSWVSNQVEHCYLSPSIVAMGIYGNNDELWEAFWGLLDMQQHHFCISDMGQIWPVSPGLTCPCGHPGFLGEQPGEALLSQPLHCCHGYLWQQ